MVLWKNQMWLYKDVGPIMVLFTCQIIRQKIHDTWFFGQLHFWILWLGCQEFLDILQKGIINWLTWLTKKMRRNSKVVFYSFRQSVKKVDMKYNYGTVFRQSKTSRVFYWRRSIFHRTFFRQITNNRICPKWKGCPRLCHIWLHKSLLSQERLQGQSQERPWFAHDCCGW